MSDQNSHTFLTHKHSQLNLFKEKYVLLMTFHLKCKIFKYVYSTVGLLLHQDRYLSTPPPLCTKYKYLKSVLITVKNEMTSTTERHGRLFPRTWF